MTPERTRIVQMVASALGVISSASSFTTAVPPVL